MQQFSFLNHGVHVYFILFFFHTGSAVVTLEAKDHDARTTPGGKVKYRFRTGSVDDFVIDSDTGQVTIADNAQLNYVTRPHYNITV